MFWTICCTMPSEFYPICHHLGFQRPVQQHKAPCSFVPTGRSTPPKGAPSTSCNRPSTGIFSHIGHTVSFPPSAYTPSLPTSFATCAYKKTALKEPSCSHCLYSNRPPVISTMLPIANSLLSLASIATMLAISNGCPAFPIGIEASRFLNSSLPRP